MIISISMERLYEPGALVPETGVYHCNGECTHSYDVRGTHIPHHFPPVPDSCTGSGWVLEAARHPVRQGMR
jgi:hypothetical protein